MKAKIEEPETEGSGVFDIQIRVPSGPTKYDGRESTVLLIRGMITYQKQLIGEIHKTLDNQALYEVPDPEEIRRELDDVETVGSILVGLMNFHEGDLC